MRADFVQSMELQLLDNFFIIMVTLAMESPKVLTDRNFHALFFEFKH